MKSLSKFISESKNTTTTTWDKFIRGLCKAQGIRVPRKLDYKTVSDMINSLEWSSNGPNDQSEEPYEFDDMVHAIVDYITDNDEAVFSEEQEDGEWVYHVDADPNNYNWSFPTIKRAKFNL